jgi:hypothetical protein
MEANEIVELVQELGPAIGVMAVVLGTVIAGWFQARVARSQSAQSHESQLQLLEKTHKQNMEMLALQQRREEDLRLRQFEESDRADRLVVIEYVDLLLPRLTEVCSIRYLGYDNNDPDELQRFQLFQSRMMEKGIDRAHPERNLGLRIAFLLFQLVGSMRIALNARWARPLSERQTTFLAHWERHIEPMICSGRYPGKELLNREQLEIIGAEMLVAPPATAAVRPLNWKEFCTRCEGDPVLRELSEIVASRLQFIFNDENSLPPRKAMQCRLAIMALYLIQLSKEAGNESWNRREEDCWRVVTDFFEWESQVSQDPKWFVFQFGDVAERARVRGGTRRPNPVNAYS